MAEKFLRVLYTENLQLKKYLAIIFSSSVFKKLLCSVKAGEKYFGLTEIWKCGFTNHRKVEFGTKLVSSVSTQKEFCYLESPGKLMVWAFTLNCNIHDDLFSTLSLSLSVLSHSAEALSTDSGRRNGQITSNYSFQT